MTATKDIQSIFESHLHQVSAEIKEIKLAAIENFNKLGFPTSKNEEWKYTPTLNFSKSEIDYTNLYPIAGDELIPTPLFEVENRIVFINGVLSLKHSTIGNEIDVVPIIEAANHASFKTYFNQLANNSNEPYTAFNTCFFTQGFLLVVKKNSIIEKPILVEYIENDQAINYLQQIRNLIVVESGAQASIIVKHSIQHELPSLSNTMNELVVEKNAHLSVFVIQDQLKNVQHINTWEVLQNADATCNFMTYSDSGQLVRNNLHIKMNAAGLTCDTKGVYIVDKKNLIDNHLKIEHLLPHCNSFQLYRGIMKEEGTGVFNGKIFVHLNAQKTDAYQSNKNLLLSNTANIYTKPQLEIFADDVKCSHGATIGNLDENALFYCLARGINKENAKSLLTKAFAQEVISNLKNFAVKNYLEKALNNKLNALDHHE